MTRAISALVGATIVLAFVFSGEVAVFVLVAILALLGLREYLAILLKKKMKPLAGVALVSSIILPLGALVRGDSGLLAGVALITVTLLVLATLKRLELRDTALTFLGTLYVSFMLSFVLLLRLLSLEAALLVILGTWTFDIFAYFVGRQVGGRRLLAKVSPGKTWAGVVGGLAATIVVLIVLFLTMGLPGLESGTAATLVLAVATAVLVGGGATLGDLVESYFKRELGVKDSGDLVPGHGGILDRFDSLMFTATIGYYWLRIWI